MTWKEFYKYKGIINGFNKFASFATSSHETKTLPTTRKCFNVLSKYFVIKSLRAGVKQYGDWTSWAGYYGTVPVIIRFVTFSSKHVDVLACMKGKGKQTLLTVRVSSGKVTIVKHFENLLSEEVR